MLLAEMTTHQTIVACLLGGMGIVGIVLIVWMIVHYLGGDL